MYHTSGRRSLAGRQITTQYTPFSQKKIKYFPNSAADIIHAFGVTFLRKYDEIDDILIFKAADFFDKQMFPRVIRVEAGDIYTTNTFGKNTSDSAEVEGIELDLGDLVTVDATTGYLKAGDGREDGLPTFQVGKVYTMPDGQPGVKIQRIA